MGEGLVHPCFLYESIWCILGFVILHNLSKKRKFSGEVFLMYCAWYGFGRGCIEILRTDSLMLGGVKISCPLCFVACAVSVALITYIRKKIKESSVEYTAVFSENLENEND
jgi:phosphatidylglycerol:prolipoprotein diacylglycerol transferase